MDTDMVMGMVMDMEKKMKEVNIHEYLPVLIDIINSGKDVNLLVTGSSMHPFLCHKRDTIIISKPSSPFKRGDMVFYQRDNGQYIMHRIHHIKDHQLYIVGDNQVEIEGPIRVDQVFGIINKVIRKGKLIQKGDFWFEFFAHIYIIIPLRPFIRKIYSLFNK